MLLVVTLYRVPSTPSLFLQTETYRNNVLDSLRFLKKGNAVETLYLLFVQFSLCDGFEQLCPDWVFRHYVHSSRFQK